MKCSQCGYESENDFSFCPSCGFGKPSGSSRFLALAKDQMFLIFCILLSVSAGLSLIKGSWPVLHILYVIFLWLTYAQMKKGVASQKHMRCLSGCLYAAWLVNLIVYALGIVGFLLLLVTAGNSALISSLVSSLLGSTGLGGFSELLAGSFVLISIFGILLCLACLVIYVLGLKRIHAFAKSLYMSMTDEDVRPTGRAKAQSWLLVFAIFNALGVLSNLSNFTGILVSGSFTAALVIAYLLVKKYYADCE